MANYIFTVLFAVTALHADTILNEEFTTSQTTVSDETTGAPSVYGPLSMQFAYDVQTRQATITQFSLPGATSPSLFLYPNTGVGSSVGPWDGVDVFAKASNGDVIALGYPFPNGSLSTLGTYSLSTVASGVNTDNAVLRVGVAAPTLLTLANLSNNVYFGGSGDYGGFISITTNCSTVPSQCAYNGFRAVAYASSHNSQIVVAFRGTDFGANAATALKNFASDTSFTNNTPSLNLIESVSDAAQFVKALEQDYPNATITLTGHSLGGAIAQLMGRASGLSTFAFNAPGSALLYPQLTSELAPVANGNGVGSNTNYRIYGDQVSLAGQQIGSTVTLPAPSSTTFVLSSDPAKELVDNFGTFLNLHSMSTLINQINVPPVSTSRQPNAVTALEGIKQGVQTLSLNESQFAIDVLDLFGYVIDPSGGTDFIFTGKSGSPFFASVDLPTLPGVMGYDLRYETSTTWSSFQDYEPATQYAFRSGVDGIEFYPVDQYGNPIAVSGFLFDVAFDSTGTFSGTLDEIQSTPEPSTIALVGFGLVFLCRCRGPRRSARRSGQIVRKLGADYAACGKPLRMPV